MMEPVLLVPPKLVEAVYKDLVIARCVECRWHRGGRHGVRIRPVGDEVIIARRAIPLIQEAADDMSRFLLTQDVGSQNGAKLPQTLRELLRRGEVEIAELPWEPAKLAGKLGKVRDHAIHPERSSVSVSLESPLARGHASGGAFKFVELFAGIGGFRLALEALGGHCVFASEIAQECVHMYDLNFSGAEVAGDITQVDDTAIPAHDLLVAGFPCQPFSSLGLKPGLADDKGMLFSQIVRVLRACRPQAFLLENVPGLLQCDDGQAFETIKSALVEVGYNVWSELVNSRCLTAQSRNRLYIVGLRVDDPKAASGQQRSFEFPFIPDLHLRARDILDPEEDLVASGVAEQYTLNDEQFARMQMSREWQHGGPNNLAWDDKICNTLVSHYSVNVGKGTSQLVPRLPPHNPRRFTPRECARLMGFPNSFKLAEKTPDQEVNTWFKSLYRMFGNAVCPPIIAVLSGAVLDHCPDVSAPCASCDWTSLGRSAAVRLSLNSLAPKNRKANAHGLPPSWSGTFASESSGELSVALHLRLLMASHSDDER